MEDDDAVPGYVTPSQENVVPHRHLPDYAALKMMGDAFLKAPVSNPKPPQGQAKSGIQVHFDVGPHYPNQPYIVPLAYTRGGESIPETKCIPGAQATCSFPDHWGVVGWKSGFKFHRDQPLAPYSTEADCLAHEPRGAQYPNSPCERRFDRNRLHSFRYVLFAHALGMQEAERRPGGYAVGRIAVTPGRNTGIADFPGGADILMTLGFFKDVRYDASNNPIDTYNGTVVNQASNLDARDGALLAAETWW